MLQDLLHISMASLEVPELQVGTSPDSGKHTDMNVTAEGPHSQAAQNIVNYFNSANGTSNTNPEDVCKSLKAMLKAKHRKIKIPKMPWIDYNWEFPLEHYYVDLTVTPKGDTRRQLQAKPVRLQDIFNPVKNKRATRILVEGPAGYGKSMLALKLCYDHSKEEDYIRDCELVILLRLRDFQAITLNEMLTKYLCMRDQNSQTILQAIQKRQSSILIILDGYDESDQHTRDDLTSLLNSEYLPEATVIVTSRPGSVDDIDTFDKRIEIKGITGVKRCHFLQMHLRSCSEEKRVFLRDFLRANFDLVLDEEYFFGRLFRKLQKVHLKKKKESLFDCPLFLLLVVAVAKNSYPNIAFFATRTELYKKLFNFVAQRTLSERLGSDQVKDVFEFDGKNQSNCVRSLTQFGKIALKALTTKQFTFSKEEILSQCSDGDVILQMGLLTANDSVDDIAGEQTSWFQPIHLSILEFCAAFYIWCSFLCQSSSFADLFLFLPDQYGGFEFLVFPFLIGLCGDRLPSFFATLKAEKRTVSLFKCFARCSSLSTESALEDDVIIESLSYLVPAVWHTSYFRGETKAVTELLKLAVAEALCHRRVTSIVHDAMVPWDICMGKKFAFVPLIAVTRNTSCKLLLHTYQRLQCIELRIFVASIPNKRWFKPDVLAKISMVVSCVHDVYYYEYRDKVYMALMFENNSFCCLRLQPSNTKRVPVYHVMRGGASSQKGFSSPSKLKDSRPFPKDLDERFYNPLPLENKRLDLLGNRINANFIE